MLVAAEKVHAPHSVVCEILFDIRETGNGLSLGEIFAIARLRERKKGDAVAQNACNFSGQWYGYLTARAVQNAAQPRAPAKTAPS